MFRAHLMQWERTFSDRAEVTVFKRGSNNESRADIPRSRSETRPTGGDPPTAGIHDPFGALSKGQERIWRLLELEPESPVYNLGFAYDLKGPLNVGALERP